VSDDRPHPAYGEERPRPAYGEERPRPAYGEYATPEQQAAAMGKKYAPPPDPATIVHTSPPQAGQPITAAVPGRRWDFFLTALLLIYGVYSVISRLFDYSNLNALAERYAQAEGVSGFTPVSAHLATALGLVVNVSDIVIFLLVAWVTLRLLRRGKIAFYVPLIGGILAGIIAFSCLAVLLLHDPAFMAHITSITPGT
jgi:hypothetical protein